MSHTEQDLATLILHRCHELERKGVSRDACFNDKYLQQYEVQLRDIQREAAPIRACIDRR
jgi:hypothetical protein